MHAAAPKPAAPIPAALIHAAASVHAARHRHAAASIPAAGPISATVSINAAAPLPAAAACLSSPGAAVQAREFEWHEKHKHVVVQSYKANQLQVHSRRFYIRSLPHTSARPVLLHTISWSDVVIFRFPMLCQYRLRHVAIRQNSSPACSGHCGAYFV